MTKKDRDEKPSKKGSQKALVCIKENEMPHVGAFKVGDRIEDPEIIAKIGEDHPFFESDKRERED